MCDLVMVCDNNVLYISATVETVFFTFPFISTLCVWKHTIEKCANRTVEKNFHNTLEK